MSTPVTNFAKVQVTGTYDSVATTITLLTGHGSRLPSTFPYPLTWWNATHFADPSDDPGREIVTVTERAGDVLTVARGAEGTTASNKSTAGVVYRMVESITAAMWTALSTQNLSQTFRGLVLGVHPDFDLSARTIYLTHADAIVMHDGVEIRDWNNLSMDLSASGAGGLDTGTELASTWYEIYAIRKISDGTRALLGHRCKDYVGDQDSSTSENTQIALRDNSVRTKLAQGMKFTTAGPLTFLDLKLAKVGNPNGQIWVTLEANSGGVPSNSPIATSDKYDCAGITSTTGWVRIPFRLPYSVSVATQYHLVLQGNYTITGSAYILWYATTLNTYANGTQATYDGATWTATASNDFMIRAYIERNNVALTMPTGYDQYALIGYAYNGSGSNLKRFKQRDRTVFTSNADPDWKIGVLSTPGLTGLAEGVPPIPVSVRLSHSGSGGPGYLAVGPLSMSALVATDVAQADIVTSFTQASTANLGTATLPQIPVEYQAMNVNVSAANQHTWVVGYQW